MKSRFEFADFDDDLSLLIAQLDQSQGEWVDSTWGNDTSPSVALKGADDFQIWVDYKNPKLSEFAEDRASGKIKRFVITQSGYTENYGARVESDDWSEIVAAATRENFEKWLDEIRLYPHIEDGWSTGELSDVLRAFCSNHGLKQMSADELLVELQIEGTHPQLGPIAKWLSEFCQRWEIRARIEDAASAEKDDEIAYAAWFESRKLKSDIDMGGDETIIGYQYSDGAWVQILPSGQFYTTVDNTECFDNTLSVVERFLWDGHSKSLAVRR